MNKSQNDIPRGSKNRHLVFLISFLHGGGAERLVQTLANEAIRQRWTLTVITLASSQGWFDDVAEKEEVSNGGAAYALPPEVDVVCLDRSGLAGGVLRGIVMPIQAVQLSLALKKERPAAVLSFLPRANLVNVLSSYCGNQNAIFLSEHSDTAELYSGPKLKNRCMKFLVQHLYPKAFRILAVSGGVKDSLASLAVPPDKIQVIYNPVDIDYVLECSNPKPDSPQSEKRWKHTLIYVGRLNPKKGQETLIRALAHCAQSLDIGVLLIGAGLRPERERLRSIVDELKLQDRVIFLGWQDNPFKYLAECDLFVLPSQYEGFGLAIVEALSCGLPVVSTDCPGGPGEILRGSGAGFLVPVDDETEMSRAIVRYFSLSKAKQETMKRCAVERAERFRADRIWAEYEDFLGL